MMNSLLQLFALSVTLACSNAENTRSSEPTPTTPAVAPAAATRSALSSYLGSAALATFYEIKLDPGGLTKHEIKKLGEQETKAYLARIDLAQKADGPLVKCPSDAVLELRDAGGNLLGKIGFCHEHARFDAPDGAFGGITAPRP